MFTQYTTCQTKPIQKLDPNIGYTIKLSEERGDRTQGLNSSKRVF